MKYELVDVSYIIKESGTEIKENKKIDINKEDLKELDQYLATKTKEEIQESFGECDNLRIKLKTEKGVKYLIPIIDNEPLYDYLTDADDIYYVEEEYLFESLLRAKAYKTVLYIFITNDKMVDLINKYFENNSEETLKEILEQFKNYDNFRQWVSMKNVIRYFDEIKEDEIKEEQYKEKNAEEYNKANDEFLTPDEVEEMFNPKGHTK